MKGRIWAAKEDYWQHGSGLMPYELDEPLPAGRVLVRIRCDRQR